MAEFICMRIILRVWEKLREEYLVTRYLAGQSRELCQSLVPEHTARTTILRRYTHVCACFLVAGYVAKTVLMQTFFCMQFSEPRVRFMRLCCGSWTLFTPTMIATDDRSAYRRWYHLSYGSILSTAKETHNFRIFHSNSKMRVTLWAYDASKQAPHPL